MANINDFKIINARSNKKFEQAAIELNVSKLINELDEFLIDCDYNKIMHDKGMDDLGIDAVYIDENDGNHIIYLFTYNFVKSLIRIKHMQKMHC